MRKIDQLFAEYSESHQNATNKTMHWICVPLIFFSIIGLVASVPAYAVQAVLGEGNPYANWAAVGLILVVIYYVSLSITLSVGMMLFSALCLIVANAIAKTVAVPLWAVSLIIFFVAWIGQFYGHKVEGTKPTFFKDIQFLLIGPAWLMHFIYKRLGIPY